MNSEQRIRYSRNTMLQHIGVEGQQRLLDASVAIVGCGALGTVASMYLAASGVAHLLLFDFDTIDISNLQRQLSFTEADLGSSKCLTLAERLRQINSEVKVTPHEGLLNAADAELLLAHVDVVLECSDNPSTKYMVADVAAKLGLPCCIGGVAQWQGQLTTWLPGGATYTDIFAEAAEAGSFMPCSIGGVLGPLPGVIGSLQACEAIKIITGAGQPLVNRLLVVDALTMQTQVFNLM